MSDIEPDPDESELDPPVKEASETKSEPRPQKPKGGDKGAEAIKVRSRSSADLLVELAGEADLFHTRDGGPYADIALKGHRET